MNAKISLFGLTAAICLAASVALAGPAHSSGRSSSASHFSGSSGAMTHGYSGATGPRISNGAIMSRTYGGLPVRSNFATRNGNLRGTRNWNGTGGNWSSNNHHHHHHHDRDFVFFSDFGYPFGYPYWWDYYPYSYYDYDQPAYADAAAYDDSLVAQVQSRLARSGYYHGAIDGVMGPETRRAIRSYERSRGLRVDGMISNSLIGTMGLR